MKLASIFETVLNMSLTGSIVILVVCLARLLLKRAPKIYSYALWALVLFRLLCPVAISSELSLIPEKVSTGSALSQWEDGYVGDTETVFDSHSQFQTAVDAGREPVDAGENGQYVVTAPDKVSAPATVESRVMPVLAVVWLGGLAVMGLYGALSFLRIRRQTRVSISVGKNVYLGDDVRSPFVMGIFRPKIYLPGTLAESERECILCHEQHHIRRGDPIFKALGFLALAIHWFNPLVWLAFSLASRDMEMSCDEAVIRKLGENVRAEYSAALLNLATGRRIVSVTPLAFGEGDPKGRIWNLANWKKPAFWVAVICVILCVVLGVCLLTNPKDISDSPVNISFAEMDTGSVTEVYLRNLHNGVMTYVTDPEDVSTICAYIKGISGINGGSSKGYYEGTYGVKLLQNYEETFSLSFGDSSTFYHGKGADGYSIRYELANRDISEVTAFLGQYDSSVQKEKTGDEILPLEDIPAQYSKEQAVVDGCVVFEGRTTYNKEIFKTFAENCEIGIPGTFRLAMYSNSDQPSRQIYDISFDGNEYKVEWAYSGIRQSKIFRYLKHYSGTREDDACPYDAYDRYVLVNDNSVSWMDIWNGMIDPDHSDVIDHFSVYEDLIFDDKTEIIPLEKLPEIYSAEQAGQDGCFVSEDGVAKENKEVFQQFAQDVANGTPGFIRLVNWHYGEDAQWSAMDLSFDGREYTLEWLEDGQRLTRTYGYLKHYTGEKERENMAYDYFEHYVLVNDPDVTWEQIFEGLISSQLGAYIEHWTVYSDYVYSPEHPDLPDNIRSAVLKFQDNNLITVTNPDQLEKLIWMFENAEYLGYEPKTHSIGTGLDLEFAAGDTNYTVELDLDSDLCRIDGEYVFYGAPDEPDYIYKLWECLGITCWPDTVYQAYPNALRP